ncbi:MAG: DUF4440 domain-containing protein, partial [Bacteroidota bacterium]
MTFPKYLYYLLTTWVAFLMLSTTVVAQSMPTGAALERTVLSLDSTFWEAYNNCEVDRMMSFVDDELEFYHDKGGQTNTRVKLANLMRSGLCKSGENEIFREAVAGSVEVFPMAGIGAILRGQHTFKGIKHPGDNGIAYFFHLWKFTNGQWKMTRIFSYDHQPLPANADVPVMELSPAALRKFAGTYKAPHTGMVKVEATSTGLSLFNGNEALPLLPKTETRFFNKQLPLEFEFVLDATGAVVKFVVYEHGKQVEEAVR